VHRSSRLSQELRAASDGYVDRILRGAKVGDLPVQFPTKFEFSLNLKAAKAIDLEISPSFFSAPTKVIE